MSKKYATQRLPGYICKTHWKKPCTEETMYLTLVGQLNVKKWYDERWSLSLPCNRFSSYFFN